jgi:hypothetical protein
MRKWIALAGLAVVAVSLAVLLAQRGRDADPTSIDGPLSSATSAATPRPSPAPSGFLPVDAFAQSEVPWSDVGQEWFLVQWVGTPPPIRDERHVGAFPSGFSLIDAQGDVYALTDLGLVDAAWVIGWRGDEVGVARQPDVAEGDSGDTAVINLRTGADTTVSTLSQLPTGGYLSANGDLLGSRYLGDLPVDVVAYRDYRFVGHVCEGNGSTRFMSPDGIRVVCLSFLPDDAQKTAVVVARADRPDSAEQIDVFRAPPYRYWVVGWLDADTFLLVRHPEGGEGPGAYFTYNIATRTIADYVPPIAGLSDSPYTSLEFDYASQTFLVARSDGVGFHYSSMVEFYGFDGTSVASVACEHPDDALSLASVTYSGDFALVSCGAPLPDEVVASLTLVSLRDGKTTSIAVFAESIDGRLGGIIGYPEHG